jgi:hypothetical protein
VSVADKTITCRDCGQPFVFSASEQAFFAERGFTDPVRCLACRRALKARKAEAAGGAPDRTPQPAGRAEHSPNFGAPGSAESFSAGDGNARRPRYQADTQPEYEDPQQGWGGDGFASERQNRKPKRPPRWIEADPGPEEDY